MYLEHIRNKMIATRRSASHLMDVVLLLALIHQSQSFILAPYKTAFHQHARSFVVSSTSRASTELQMGVGSTIKRARDSILAREYTRDELTVGIAGFYDRSSQLWEEVWGEHMHHGYYDPPDRTDHVQAQIDLIDEVLEWAGVPEDGKNSPKAIVDVGCGIGGSSRHISRKYGCTAQGITLSPYQAKRGNELAKEQGLADRCNFQVRHGSVFLLALFPF